MQNLIKINMEEKDGRKFIWRKIVVLGDHEVGKTTLIRKFCEGKFSEKYQPTIGADYGHKHCIVDNKEVEVTFWDLAGGKEFQETRSHLLIDTQICLLVCDISHDNIKNWISEIEDNGIPLNHTGILVNKMDQCENDKIENLKRLAASKNIKFFPVSAKTGEGVSDAILTMLSESLH